MLDREASAAGIAALGYDLDRGTHPVIGAAAADIGDRLVDVGIGGIGLFLEQRVQACERAGIGRERIVVDPGFGFGKTVRHNLQILKNLPQFTALGLPVLAGWSRKSTLGKLTGRPADERLAPSLAAALLALQGGATILRVHDVKETRDVIAVWEAYKNEP